MPNQQSDTILIVGADTNHTYHYQDLLVADGFRTEIVSTAAQALERLKTNGLSLLLIDMRLPDSDGVALAERVLCQIHLPVVLYGNLPINEGTLKRIRRLGISFVSKVTDSDVRPMTEVVNEVIEEHRTKIQLSNLRSEQQSLSTKVNDMQTTILASIDALGAKIYPESKLLEIVNNHFVAEVRERVEHEVKEAREGLQREIVNRTSNFPAVAQSSILNAWWFRGLVVFILTLAPLWLNMRTTLQNIEKKIEQAAPLSREAPREVTHP